MTAFEVITSVKGVVVVGKQAVLGLHRHLSLGVASGKWNSRFKQIVFLSKMIYVLDTKHFVSFQVSKRKGLFYKRNNIMNYGCHILHVLFH